MNSVMERLCCGCWSLGSRKPTAGTGAAAAAAYDDADDDILIEAIDLPVRRSGTRSGAEDVLSWFRRLPDRRRVHHSHSDAGSGGDIAIVSRGQIKYVKDGSFSSSHVPVPIIDPLIGRRTGGHHQQRQLFPQLQLLRARTGIFHFHNRQQQQQQWWDSATPPSSVDLEWEHEGLMAPEEAAAASLAVEASESDEGGDEVVLRRSPSPGSACHSLEWDGDDFIGLAGHQQQATTAAAAAAAAVHRNCTTEEPAR